MGVMRRLARKSLEVMLAHFGYVLKPDGLPPRGFSSFLRFIHKRGFSPRSIFDVGVGYGTPWLYDAFPKARFVLIEPLEEFEPYLQKTCRQLDAEYHLVGAGATRERLPVYRPANGPTGSSFRPRTRQRANTIGTIAPSDTTFEILPLDEFADREGPILLKIDTEGYERDVLQGAQRLLSKTELVIMEIAVEQRHQDEADLAELAILMKDSGFRLFDIPNMAQQSMDGPLMFIDAAFARRGGVLLPHG